MRVIFITFFKYKYFLLEQDPAIPFSLALFGMCSPLAKCPIYKVFS
jgi:hypothetical protein